MKFSKKSIICFIIILLLVIVVSSIAFSNKKVSVSFKNPKTIAVSNEKSTVNVSYEDNGDNVYKEGTYKEISNDKLNYRLKFNLMNYNAEQYDILKRKASNSKNSTTKSVRIKQYRGFVVTDNNSGYSQLYLPIDLNNNVIFNVKMVNTKYNDNGEKNKTSVYNLNEVQQILNSIEYK